VNDFCLTPSEKFVSLIMIKISYLLMVLGLY